MKLNDKIYNVKCMESEKIAIRNTHTHKYNKYKLHTLNSGRSHGGG